MKWDRTVLSDDGVPVLYIMNLVHVRGRRIDLHKIVKADMPDCYHTHPANAFRVVLWGGYEEELWDWEKLTWKPGMIGYVAPELCHRIHRLLNGRMSYSLWFRGRVTHKVELRGLGWKNHQ